VVIVIREVDGAIFFDDDAIGAVEGGFQSRTTFIAHASAPRYGADFDLIRNV
jgi:hypothetical protein